MTDHLDKDIDPTRLTTQMIWRESATLKELFEIRFDAYDRAIILLQELANRSPTISEVYLQHEARFKTFEEKFETVKVRFDGVDKQFMERDIRGDKSGQDTKTAIDAALASQEKAAGKLNESSSEAILKQEASFSKQIDQQGELLRTEVRGLVAQINELKDRFNRGEGRGEGKETNKKEGRDTGQYLIAAVGLGIGLIGVAVAVVVALNK